MFKHVDHDIVLPRITRKNTDVGRKYFTPEGNSYPSITTVLSIVGKDSLQEWRKRVGEEEANRVSSFASKRGTAVHKLAEDYLNNVENFKKGHMPTSIASFLPLKPILDERLNNIWMQEQFLYSDKLKCAGQVDCIAEFDGELSIVDFKTSRKEKKAEWITNYFIQASFYAAAFLERTGVAIKQGVILITVDDGSPQVFKIDTYDYLEHFLALRKKFREMYNI